MSRLQAQGFSRGSFHCSHSNVISYLQLIRLSSLVLSLVSAPGLPSASVLQVLLICEGINTDHFDHHRSIRMFAIGLH